MKKNVFFAGILSIVLAFGMVVVGCTQPTDSMDPTEYTITFNADGGTVTPASVKVESGETAETLPVPTKTEGDTVFWGWYTENGTSGWGSPFTTSTVVTADITLYARWGSTVPVKYTVTFDADGGTVTPASTEVISGDKAGTLPKPTKSGNTFGGWYTAQNGGGTQFTAATTVTAAITVYAKWTATGSSSGSAIDAKWQGKYTTDEGDYVTVHSNTATYSIDGTTGTRSIATGTGGDILFLTNIDVGDWVYILSEGSVIGFAMTATDPRNKETITSIGIGAYGVTSLMKEVTSQGGTFSPEPSISGLPDDFYFWGTKE
jgi:uncharacterized repeat protein (TIGR02543 family)